jgi:tRNA nucleotidyltransferase/poly(A) polymerase
VSGVTGDAVAGLLAEPALASLLDVLNGDGEETRIVGGAVRDALLGRPVGDVDLATTAEPETVIRRARRARLRTVPTGIEHGTVTVIVHRQPFQVTTLRRDVETDGRHAVVAFGRDWATDARRRDFTINGMSLGRDGAVHDHVGGLDDLAHGRVRFIGAPDRRIAEDYLRILRFFRFHAGYGQGAPDAAALEACIAGRHGLARLSRERVRAELLKLLVAAGAASVVELMGDIGLLGWILGGVPRVRRLQRLAAIEAGRSEADPIRRLAAVGLFVREDSERLRERLRLSNEEAARLAALAEPLPAAPLDGPAARAALYREGAVAFRDRVLVGWAAAAVAPDDPAWRRFADLADAWPAPHLPVRGADLIARGLAPGPALGQALAAIEARWIEADFPGDPAWIEAAIEAVRGEMGAEG